jgi:hypothetical protein
VTLLEKNTFLNQIHKKTNKQQLVKNKNVQTLNVKTKNYSNFANVKQSNTVQWIV